MDMQLERQYCIDNMGETLYERMVTIAHDSPFDSISIYEEWIVDGEDPEDNEYKFIFLDNFTLETT